jgi:hypothetical protein
VPISLRERLNGSRSDLVRDRYWAEDGRRAIAGAVSTLIQVYYIVTFMANVCEDINGHQDYWISQKIVSATNQLLHA